MRVECANCGRVVEVQGLPAICPFCERRIGASIAPPLTVRPGSTTPPPIAGQVDHLSEPEAAPYFPTQPAPIHWQKPVLVGVCVLLAALALFLVVAGVRAGIKRLTASFQQPSTTSSATASAVTTGTTVVQVPRPTGRLAPTPPPAQPQPAQPAEPAAPTQLVPVRSAAAEAALTDQRINESMRRAVDYLAQQITAGPLIGANPEDRQQGEYAVAVLALLYAGQSTFDQRLAVSSPLMADALERLKTFPMDGQYATYCRSLRTAALAMHDRREDRRVLTADLRWLIGTGQEGRYTYNGENPKLKPAGGVAWDNSNTQYAVLGVWAAAEAGLTVPREYWQQVERHWLSTQKESGGWAYATGFDSTTITMTCAGINMLFVARDQLRGSQPMTRLSDTAYPPEIQRAIDWLSSQNRSTRLRAGHHEGYALYGLERAGLASGLRRFGPQDWYRSLAQGVLNTQLPDGSWKGSDGAVPETAFRVIFLARGRHPIVMSKLQFDGVWNNRPRDLARLSEFVKKSIERPVNWQVVSLNEDWADWMDAPILYLASHEAMPLDDAAIDKLRSFALAGGLLFTHADIAGEKFSAYVADELAPRLFPQWPLADLPQDHPIYSSLYPLHERPALRGVSNGSRLLLVHSPTDLSGRWQFQSPERAESAFELGANLFTYATGKHALRQRLDTPVVPEPSGEPIATVGVGRLRHSGNWDPEPAAWQRMARLFQTQTSIRLDVRAVEPLELDRRVTPLVHLTTTDGWSADDNQAEALRRYVSDGGVLLVDVTGGNQQTVATVREALGRVFAGGGQPLGKEHPIVAGTAQGMAPLEGPGLRAYAVTALGTQIPAAEIIELGQGAVIFSPLDLTSGLLDTTTWGIIGHQPAYCQQLVSNLILWTINERGLPGAWTPH